MTESEIIIVIKREIKGLQDSLVDNDYSDAVDNSERDTGFALPVTSDFQVKWLKERIKRHLFFALWTESATSFKFKQINLQQKFEHFGALIDKMDKDFEKAQTENAYEFAQVEATQFFGHKIDVGFSYDTEGRETTFDSDQLVVISPRDID
jgi:hypothetical protein